MALTRRSANSDAAAAATANTAAKAHQALDAVADAAAAAPSRRGCGGLPAPLQFPCLATLSFCMASLGYSLVGELTGGELAAVSRNQETWGELAVLAGWRLAELALAWFGNLDGLDVAMLDLLAHGPLLFLLTTFYSLSAATTAAALVVDVLAAAVPFYALRPLSSVHRPSARVANRELVDLPLQLYTTALSTGIYTVVVVLSLRFLLPRVLVVHFGGLPSLEPAYAASYAAVLPATALFGAAASAFVYAPFATTGRSDEDDEIARFDPAAATLRQTLRWNLWGYTARTKVVVRRTAAVMLVTGVNTYLACTRTMHGIEAPGAASYAAVWVFAALCTGLALGLVGGE